MAITNFEVYATRLRDDRLSVKLKQTIAHELCESLEFFQLQDYSRFVSILWPVIRDLLLKTPPVFVSTAPEQRLRSTLLEIIQRIPHSEVFKPIVQEVVTTLVSLVKIENEDNAVVCLKIIYELHRMYRQLLESIAQPFLELASEIYRNADQMLKAMDSMDTPASLSTPNVNLMSPSAMSPGPDTGDAASKNLSPATASFKVLTEVPIIVVSIIQANRRHAEQFVTGILPLILHMLELNQRGAGAQSEGAGHSLRAANVDLITAQSKTLSFLAFFARGFTALLLPFQDRIAKLTLGLLCACPAESTATRKEMLIATRHIVATEIRKAFVPLADRFLDMQVLVGSGLASQCILKPFAFSLLADLMHHIRAELSPRQLTLMVEFYAGCMHDQSLSSGVHTMCAKLLHNITECIMQIPDRRHGRVLLLSILRTFVSSFAAIGNNAETAINNIRTHQAYAEEKIYGAGELIRTNAFEQGDRIKELRFLLRSLVTGCKNVIYALRKCNSTLALGMHPQAHTSRDEDPAAAPPPPQSEPGAVANPSSIISNQEAELAGFELDLLTALLREGLRACRIHDIDRVKTEVAAGKSDDGGSGTRLGAGMSREAQLKLVDREGKEQLEQFANLFVNLDPAVFHELFTSQFDYAFHAMVDHCAAISSVQVFVACESTSPAFISIMLRYLCDRLDLLGSDDEPLTSTMLHMFKIAFLALAFFPEANEPVLQPYVQPIINSALNIRQDTKRPENYFLLLRALFRSIGGGRYESLYKEVCPVLQSLLEMLNSALGFTKRASPTQELFVEICLTVPVRLSVLLPFLSLLMRPLVFALESGPELVSQGLRTLELCIDNLTREFLDPILTPVMDDIMTSLWLHLQLPSSASTHAPVAARILGKLGGRNRHMLITRFPADSIKPSDAEGGGVTAPLAFEGLSGLVSMPLSDAVLFSTKILEDRVLTKHPDLARKDAVDFIVACARYVLVDYLAASAAAADSTAWASECGRQLIKLTVEPLAQKRLANISLPATQGSQLFEQIIAATPSIGDMCKADSCTEKGGQLAIDAVSQSTAPATASLNDLCARAQPSIGTVSVTYGGLMSIIWALGLASGSSDEAQGLMKAIITQGAQQHIVQCISTVQPEATTDKSADASTAALASAIPDVISRMLVARSELLGATGCRMLQHYYNALSGLLENDATLLGHLPTMRKIVSDLCAACYNPDTAIKRGGCVGIAFAVRELDLGHGWLTENLLELSKALLFTLKDASSSAIQSMPSVDSRATLLEIVRKAFPVAMFAMADGDDGLPAESVASRDKDGDVEMSDANHPDDSADPEPQPAASIPSSLPHDADLADLVKASVGGADDVVAAVVQPQERASDALAEQTGGASGADTSSDGKVDSEQNAEARTSMGAEVDTGGSSQPPDDAKEINSGSMISLDSASADATNTASDTAVQPADGDQPDGADAAAAAVAAAANASAMAEALRKTQAAFQKLSKRLSPENGRLLRSFLALIAKELANPSTEVREAAKACLNILVEVTGCSTTALLLPSRDRLLVPIFGKPLRALPHNMQIGNIDAITYCLGLDPPFLEINEELLRLLSEALALADAEDQALVNHPTQVHSSTASLTHLRHVCIRMLTAAMARPEFADEKNSPTRARIISVFFKSLYHKSVEVVDAANDGLKQVLRQQQKLPRDLLQTGLRPILINLSDYKRLTVASLDGLARLLQLLTNYFKAEVGRKLLDHMQQWANPQLLQAAAERSIEDMHEIKILVAILQVFHLLPPLASVLLDDLVSSVVNLEVHLCRRESSPFRKPLFKFLNRYPSESVVYFTERIESAHYARIFCHAISSPECGPLREALVAQTPRLVSLLKDFGSAVGHTTDMAIDQEGATETASADALHKRVYVAMSVVAAIRGCLEFIPLWLSEHDSLMQAVLEAWAAALRVEATPDRSSHLARPMLVEHVVCSLLQATRAMANPPALLFKLLEVAGRSSEIVDTSFVFRYVWDDLVVQWSIAKRREILGAFLPRLADNSVSDESNAIVLQHLINPMVATVFTLPNIALASSPGGAAASDVATLSPEQRGAELLRAPILSLIHQRGWQAHMTSGSQPMVASKASVRLELVQLSSILIRHASTAVADLRKDVIKFGWLFIRNDDIMIKNASYVLVAQFIAAFDTPPKIILQAYSSLLKAHQVESRFLVRQALDILLPVLPVRLGQHANEPGTAGTAGLPAWALLAKRILIDNSASLAHTTHVYQLIAGHPAIFFPFRMQFASNLVGILQKMCLTHSATSETRTLALDIMELFLAWHDMLESHASADDDYNSTAVQEFEANRTPEEDSSAARSVSNGSLPAQPDLLLPESRRETIVGLLLRMLCLVFDFVLKSNLGPRALELLQRYLDAAKWPPMHLRLTFFERSIQQIEALGMNQQLVQHILTVLSAVTSQMQAVWFEEYFGVLATMVRKCVVVDDGQVQKLIATMLRQLYEQAAANERLGSSPAATDLRAHIEALVNKNLQDGTNTFGTLLILHSIGEFTGEQLYSYIPLLMKHVQKYTKEHNTHAPALATGAAAAASASSLQPAGSAASIASLGSETSAQRPAGSNANGNNNNSSSSSSEILSTVAANGQVPLVVDAIVKGETPLDILLMLLLLLRQHISHLGDQRRSFLTYIIQLIERSSDPALLHVILAIVREWVLDPQDVFPTIKEKAMLMSSMMSFVHGSASANDNVSRASVRASAGSGANGTMVYSLVGGSAAAHETDGGDPFALLERKYLSLVLEVYNDPRFTRSEMTMRLEQAFLSGMQSEDSEMRSRFLSTFDANMPPALPVRLNYLLETQSWESVASTFWLQQCLPLLFASTLQRGSHLAAAAAAKTETNGPGMEVDAGDMAEASLERNGGDVGGGIGSGGDMVSIKDIMGPLSRMVLLDTSFAYQVWVAMFPRLWQNLSSKERHDLTSGLIRLLAKPYHLSQTSARPNVIQAILDGFCACSPAPRLPPQLLRYLGQTYSAWYPALTLLEQKIMDRHEIESAIFDRATGVELGAFDALAELYTSLSASHYFYGAWKRHCQYNESHVALAYEQLDDWSSAQAAYERAQTKARAGVLPFSEAEYCLWESRWIETTKRLQSWDMLLELGLHESLPEIELEAGWRTWDWNERQTQVRQLLKATPAEFAGSSRAKFYETYLALVKGSGERAKTTDFQRMCKEGIKACLQEWNELPPVGTPAHIGILHLFQLMVELGDASNIYTSLAATKAENLEAKSGDLKSVLQTWRERLPNNSDPINIWSDLVAWRQHIFKAINDVYVPFITQPQPPQQSTADDSSAGQSDGLKSPNKSKADAKNGRKDADDGKPAAGATNSALTSYAYRGYHEMAWIINRFAHVARLHGLVDVCIGSLTRIYTLPNIEIQEAFLKLREQAKCYYDRPQELQSGLDVISNTNLMYFSRGQKAEFFTLKGQFLAKLGKLDEANHAFATGAQLELNSPKAWAAWGRYNDECFCRNLPDTTGAVNAISCYMQAAGLAKRPRVRRFLARTLWLLSQDDANGSVCAAFDAYNGEMPTWYWIALVPQLLAGLDAPYSRQAQQILLRIAKQYPQALYYALRTAREESLVQRRQQAPAAESGAADPATPSQGPPAPAIDELMPKLKTAHPLLTLSMEAMIDQIVHRLKPCPEEDIYRLAHALLSDGLQQLHQQVSQGKTDLSLIDAIVSNTCRVGLSLPSGAIKTRFEADFGRVRDMDLCEYVTKLYQWQQMLRQAIRQRPRTLMLSLFSPFLVEFEQQKFEDVEIPGQYLRLTDSSDDFVRIERFIPELHVVLRSSGVLRTLAIRGSDGSITHFSVQHFTSRYNHQEERWVQFFRNLDAAGEHDRNTWEQHRIALHLPTIVSLAPHIRLVQEQPGSFTLQDVYDRACESSGNPEIVPALYAVGKMRDLVSQLPSVDAANELLFEQTCQRLVPPTLLRDDIRACTASPMEYWLYRENFSYQISASAALTYMIACTQRTPAKLNISRASGSICLHDLVPTQATPGLVHSKEPVPFRLTPNIQTFVTELGLEGIVPFAIYRVVQRFTGTEHLLRDFLDLFVRDELIHVPAVKSLAAANPQALAEMCERNVKLIEHRAGQMVEILPAKEVQDQELSPMQPLIRLMMQAVAPANLAKMDFIWAPWL